VFVVTGVHGAGLSHLVFCHAGTQVIEMALPEPHALYFEHLAKELKLGYTKVHS
jgi:capsular polysaccharide biosynthesis protein